MLERESDVLQGRMIWLAEKYLDSEPKEFQHPHYDEVTRNGKSLTLNRHQLHEYGKEYKNGTSTLSYREKKKLSRRMNLWGIKGEVCNTGNHPFLKIPVSGKNLF